MAPAALSCRTWQPMAIFIEGGSITDCTGTSGTAHLIYMGLPPGHAPAGTFYLKPNSGLVLSGNTTDNIATRKSMPGETITIMLDLKEYLVSGLSFPASDTSAD